MSYRFAKEIEAHTQEPRGWLIKVYVSMAQKSIWNIYIWERGLLLLFFELAPKWN